MSTPPPTPETDSKSGYPDDSGCWKYNDLGLYVDADFARRLERERDEARDQVQAMREAIREVSLQLTFAEKVSGASVLHIYVYDALTKLQPFLS
jgi:hypothetical protein